MRLLYILLGLIAVALAVAGVVLPLLPTTPFLLVAAWAFAKSSPRLERWLVTHPRLGPPIDAWRERGAIGTRVKVVSLSTMAASLIYITLFSGFPLVAKAASAALLAACATFIASRPSS
jgi:uncharacterized membrane protein YbaN (DUF454 family)